MIPVNKAIEPAFFDTDVRKPGQSFLLNTPNPTNKQWRSKEYWQKALPTMRTLYSKMCAYSACWIPYATGSHSIDHFIPKALDPTQAYEWDNFRYVSTRFNSRKGVKSIVDPCSMQTQWFVLDFITFFIKPNAVNLSNNELKLANETINILKLNEDDELVKERQAYFQDYKDKHINYDYLNRAAPFIAAEMQRQNLI